MKRLGLLLLTLSFVSSALFAGTVKGLVTDAKSGNPLVGANVYMDGTTFGAATDMDGAYMIEVPDGNYNLVCSYVGYKQEEKEIKVSGDLEVNFEMKEFSFSQSIVVVADRAKELETPVAFTDMKKAEMEVKLGSQDLPLVLNTTPSVYSTMQGGGAGDARINVRGFNQRNVAIMINGVPVNDMENGWVYWSNWDGVGDATASMQVQRGLSAVNLATPSIGGTMNIITDPSAQEAGFKFKQEVGNDGFLKSTLFANTGLVNDTWAVSAGIVRKVGDGLIDKTWTDAWAYYLGAQYNINKTNRLEIYAIGAPQRHGQNLYKQNIAAYDSSYAKTLTGFGGYDVGGIQRFKQSSSGRKWNENWNTVNSSYNGQQYWDGSASDRYDSGFINERENYYHKPLVNLNWYSQLSDNFNLYTVLYYSGGTGGGSGTYGHMDYDYSGPSRRVDWNTTIANNLDPNSLYHGEKSQGILRNSVNNQWTIGALVKAYWKPVDNTTFSFGLDWRTAEIDHYREVRDLLGLASYTNNSSDFGPITAKLGDKIAYNFTNNVDWIGAYAQGEYQLDKITAYGTIGLSGITYKHTNHFKSTTGDATGSEIVAESDMITGLQIKGGASYRITSSLMAYGNLGYVSKVPIFDNVIDDYAGTMNDNPKNEKFYSFEAGVDWRGLDGQLTLKGNVYYTIWNDRSNTRGVTLENGNDILISLEGIDQTHMGLEMEAAYQPIPMFRLDFAGSIAQWEHTSDANGTYKDYSDPSGTQEFHYYIDGLKIGDAPQQQFALSGSVFPIQGMQATLGYRFYNYFYADWSPFDRTNPDDHTQSWRLPSYGIMDFHLNYILPFDLSGVELRVFAHVFNILDEVYVQDAVDNSHYNGYYGANDGFGHNASRAEVFMGLPRTFNIGFGVNY